MKLPDRLISWAQNEENIDGHYLAHGRDCLEAAEVIREQEGYGGIVHDLETMRQSMTDVALLIVGNKRRQVEEWALGVTVEIKDGEQRGMDLSLWRDGLETMRAQRNELMEALENLTERVEMVNRGVAESIETIMLCHIARDALAKVKP